MFAQTSARSARPVRSRTSVCRNTRRRRVAAPPRARAGSPASTAASSRGLRALPVERRVERRREPRTLVGARGEHGARVAAVGEGVRGRGRRHRVRGSGRDRCVALASSAHFRRDPNGWRTSAAAAATMRQRLIMPSARAFLRAPGAFSSALARSVRRRRCSAASRCSRSRCSSCASSSFRRSSRTATRWPRARARSSASRSRSTRSRPAGTAGTRSSSSTACACSTGQCPAPLPLLDLPEVALIWRGRRCRCSSSA